MFFGGLAAVHLDAVGGAFTIGIVHTLMRRAGDGHAGVGHPVAYLIGRTVRDAGIGIATGFVALASIRAIHLDIGAATTLIFIAGTMDHVAFQLGHTNNSFLCRLRQHTFVQNQKRIESMYFLRRNAALCV